MSNNDWYRYYAPRRLAAQTAQERANDRAAAEHDLDALLAHIALTPADRILEIGCGWGRHSLALAKRGFKRVVSIDIAPEPLVLAQAIAAEAGLACSFQRQDFLSIIDGPYHAILSLYDRSVCGFPTEAQDAHSLRHLAGLLAPGGWLVFGINDWPFVLPEARRDWRITPDGMELSEVVPDRAAMTCTDRVTLVRPNGEQETYELTRRHYYLPELRRMLCDAGLTLRKAFHRLAGGRTYGTGEHGLFIFAQKEQ